VFSPDSKHLADVSVKVFAVLDGLKGPEFPASTCWGPVFSSDSRHFAFTIGHWSQDIPGHQRAFLDWQPLRLPNNGPGVVHVFFSPDLKRWGCILQRQNEKQVFIDGHYGPWFQSAWGLRFSPDGSRYAYLAQVKANWWMVVDGKLQAEISINPASPCFSPNSKRLAYIAGRGPMWWIVVDGKAGPKFKGQKGRTSILSVGEEELPALTQPQFSPDSAHIGYAALQGDQWGVLLDNKPVGPKYERIIDGGPSFHEDGSLEFLGIRKSVLYRIVVK
jgi:hypothetical protein